MRKDKGTRKPHPSWCAHCAMVREYREYRELELERRGGFRNENAKEGILNLIEFQAYYYRELRAQREAA